jgi:hypothetical protein
VLPWNIRHCKGKSGVKPPHSKMCRYLELVFQQPVYGSLGNKQPDFQGAMLEPSM